MGATKTECSVRGHQLHLGEVCGEGRRPGRTSDRRAGDPSDTNAVAAFRGGGQRRRANPSLFASGRRPQRSSSRKNCRRRLAATRRKVGVHDCGHTRTLTRRSTRTSRASPEIEGARGSDGPGGQGWLSVLAASVTRPPAKRRIGSPTVRDMRHVPCVYVVVPLRGRDERAGRGDRERGRVRVVL